MEAVKKWLAERSTKKDGIYVHYSPPKAVGASAAQLRQWARSGAGGKLERAVLAGHGRRLLAEARAQLGPAAAPALQALVVRCTALHAAVERGSLAELQELLDNDPNRRKSVMCCDEAGVGLLHKAVYYDYMDIAEWLVDNYPQLVHQKDSEGRTALHYAGSCRDAGAAAALLERAGAARGARDAAGRTAAHYHRTPLTLPVPPVQTTSMAPDKHPQALAIKRHNIRIWCHDCDMARLQRVVWEGHGARLLSEVSNQPVVKRFLEAVPYIMNTIREIHNAVVQNDLEGLIKHASDPVPPQALSSRDANYMTVLHKAAGLGHASMVKYIVDRYPKGINDVDNDGRTPLHYAAIVKDDQHTYNTLVGFGADEGAVDNKNRTPGYYLNRPQDIDKNVFKTLPEAPRTASNAYPSLWDWKLLDTEVITDLNKKSKKKGSNLNGHSNKTNSISDNIVNRTGMKASSTNEFIKGLPELEDNAKISYSNIENGKDQEVLEDKETTEKNLDTDQMDPSANETNLKDTGHEIEDESIEKVDPIVENDNDHETAEINTNQEDVVQEPDEADIKSESPVNDENVHEQTQETIENASNEHQRTKEENQNEIDKENEIMITDKEHLDTTENENNTLSQKISSGNINDNEGNHPKLEDTNEENVPNDNLFEPTDESQNIVIEDNKNDEEAINDENNHKTDSAKENTVQETEPNDMIEGNINSPNNEDDDDVQVQGDSNSEYSDSNLRSTAEASDTKSAKRGNANNGRNTQESLIEGIINGEADQESQDASVLQRDDTDKGSIPNMVDNEIDPEVTELINTANMEMLAALVLNGEGARLVGRTSRNSELQAFLDNVPTYMQKINRVHLAAKEGNIKELQAALDRRKFAIARDPISPNGATPLHVATVFGKTNIVKYLGGRFPETLSAVDFEGRTALHYAAVLPDNGHYYNLLQQLGSNSKDLDDNGRSAEDYFKNPTLFPFKQLLAEFDISEEAAKDMLSDKSTDQSLNGHMDIPIFRTEEGRYLAKSLGDPLIKGLTEVANAKPKDPVAFLATFLQNFPDHEKPRLGTQETNVIVTREAAEVENEQPPPAAETRLDPEVAVTAGSIPVAMAAAAVQAERLERQRTAVRPRPIDVVTVDPQTVTSPDAPEIAFTSTNRDEHGQSMLHFAAARTHSHNALFQLLQESDVSLAYRDELYRTARDVSIQANVPENTAEIDRWVLHVAARGNSEKIMELLLEGYDHILDVVDEEGVPIVDVISQRGHSEMSSLLASIPAFEESRESMHSAARRGDLENVTNTFTSEGGRTLARAKNFFGRTILHIAVLAQEEEVVDYLAQHCPELLRIGDNLERTPLHYAMGVDKMESLSRVLIKAGAKRVLKDLKGRQPSYYFMNKSDILRLKEEEDIN